MCVEGWDMHVKGWDMDVKGWDMDVEGWHMHMKGWDRVNEIISSHLSWNTGIGADPPHLLAGVE